MAEGWIKLHRSIRKNWIWEDPLKLKWWLDILLQANHQERKILIGNEIVLIERGSFHTSIIKLSERWKVDRKTVKRFLDLLQKDNMISLKTSKKGTTLTISNYKDYQAISEPKKDNGEDNDRDNSEDNKVPTEGATIGTDKSQISPNKEDTNKNEEEGKKNSKNENNDQEGREGEEMTPSPPPLIYPTLIHEKIFNGVGEIGYRTWFMDSAITDGEKITIGVKSDFMAAVITDKFKDNLEKMLGKNIRIEIREEI